MHNATTKQRLSALRRKLGIFSGAPRWVRERRARLARFEAAAASMLGFGHAAERAAEATPTPALAGGMQMLSSSLPDDEPAPERWVSTSMIEPATQETSQKTEVVTTSDLVRDTSASSPRQVSTSMIEPATRDASQQWTRETARRMDLDTTSDLVRTGKAAGPRSDLARSNDSEGATRPARSGFPRRAAAIAAAAVAAVVGLFLALRPRAPAPPERAPEVEAPALPAPALPAPAAAAPAPETAARPPAPAPAAVVIRRGDTLWALAAAHLGDPMLWPRLHAANRDRIRDPDLIYPGQQIDLPER
jgi:nucleoid-associated protein YgaU